MHLELDHIFVRFGHTTALHDISFHVRSDEIVCLLGDNGAGKSTLIRVLSGVLVPATGSYRIDGEGVRFSSPREALARGIATVHQDLGLIPLMSVWRNFVLGAEPTRGRSAFQRIDIDYARAAARTALTQLGIELRDIDQPVGTLSGGERQSLAIARAIQRGAQMLILDEPTAALGVRQVEITLNAVRKVRERGVGVVLVTHNPTHAYGVGDRFVVLRQGKAIAQLTREEVQPAQLAELMSS